MFQNSKIKRKKKEKNFFLSFRYRQLLVRTLHTISMKFPDVAGNVIPILMDFLSDNNELAATDVLVFVREAIQRFEVSFLGIFFPNISNLTVFSLFPIHN